MKWLWRIGIVILLLWSAGLVGLWFTGNALLDGTHAEPSDPPWWAPYFNTPERYGMWVEKRPCAAGVTQCLIVSARAGEQMDPRVQTLRKQVESQGMTLPSYGESDRYLVMLHGWRSRKEDLLAAAMRYAGTGFTVILPDLPGHGESTLPQSWATAPEAGEIAARALTEQREMDGQPQQPAYLWGLSMGSVYANRNAWQHPEVFSGLVIAAGLDELTLELEAQLSDLPDWLKAPVLWQFKQVMRWRGLDIAAVSPARWATEVRIPVLQFHGDQDEMIPYARGRALFAAYASTDKTWLDVPGAGHQTLFSTAQPLFMQTVFWLRTH